MAKTMTLEFEGFFQCRLATDPDPPSETRGLSGYTFALGCESDLDQVIKLQRDEIEDRDFRQPFPPYLHDEKGVRFGVFVKRVKLDGQEVKDSPFRDAPVRWPGRPKFELRNQIVADGFNRLVPVISPFAVDIEGKDGARLRRSDPLDPEHPELEIWQLRPEQYVRRVPTNFFQIGSQAIQRLFSKQVAQLGSVNAFYNAYFEVRTEWLELEISKVAAAQADGGPEPSCSYDVQLEALQTRIFVIDQESGTATDPGRIEDRLGIQTVWDFDVVGRDGESSVPGGTIPADRPWHTRFWMAGWDGDLLVGYLSGQLDVPFEPC